MTVRDFKEHLRSGNVDHLIDSVLMGREAVHVPELDIQHIEATLAATYGSSGPAVSACIVGSAKLGFSTSEKNTPAGKLPRYRAFSPLSDIDVAVVSEDIFNRVWHDLSAHAHSFPRLPWDSGPLGDYLICGWLRPDKFPKRVRLRACDDWWTTFHRLSAELRFNRHKVRGGLFANAEHLRRYLSRSISECAQAEALKL